MRLQIAAGKLGVVYLLGALMILFPSVMGCQKTGKSASNSGDSQVNDDEDWVDPTRPLPPTPIAKKTPQLPALEKLKRSIKWEQLTQSATPPVKGDFKYPEKPYRNRAEFNHALFLFRATCIDEFLQRNPDHPQAQQVAEFLRRCLRHEIVGDDVWLDLHDVARQLVDVESMTEADPLLLGYFGLTAIKSGQGELARKALLHSLAGFQKTDYSSRHIVRIARAYANLLLQTVPHRDVVYHAQEAFSGPATYWLNKDLKATPKQHGLVCYEMRLGMKVIYDPLKNFGDRSGNYHGPPSVNQRYISEENDLPEYIDAFLHGVDYSEAAWAWRGEGVAATVPESIFIQFHDRLAKAAVYFEKAWEICPAFAITAEAAIPSAHDDIGKMNEWLERAYEAQDDGGFCLSAVSNFLLPRWGGSHEMAVELARKYTLKSDDPDSALGLAIPDTLWGIQFSDKNLSFYKDEKLMDLAIDRLEKMIEVRDDKSWDYTQLQLKNRLLGLLMAARYRPDDETVALAKELLPDLSPEFENGFTGRNPEIAVASLAEFKGIEKSGIRNTLLPRLLNFQPQSANFDEINKKAGDILKEKKTAAERMIWEYFVDEATFRRDLLSRKWVNLHDFDARFRWDGLYPYNSRVQHGDSILLVSEPGSAQLIGSGSGFGESFAVEFDIEFHDIYGDRASSGVGLYGPDGHYFMIGFNPRIGFVFGGIWCSAVKRPKYSMSKELDQTRFKAQVLFYRGHADVFINGVFQDTYASPEIDPKQGFMLCSNFSENGCSSVEYRNIRIKKLDPMPRTVDSVIDWLGQVYEATGYSTVALQQGNLLTRKGRIQEAYECYDRAEKAGHPSDEVNFFRALSAMHENHWNKTVSFLRRTVHEVTPVSSRYKNHLYGDKVVNPDLQNEALFLLCLVLCAAPDENVYDEKLYQQALSTLGRIEGPMANTQRMVAAAVKAARDGEFQKARQVLQMAYRQVHPRTMQILNSTYRPAIMQGKKIVLDQGSMNDRFLLFDP